MTDTKQPLGYGHDKKGAAGGGTPAASAPQTIKLTLDGREVEAPVGETIFRTAERHGITLPNLCYSPAPGYRPDGNCRVCMVEIEGERVLAASCLRTPTDGMKVKTQTDRAKAARRMVAELLLTDQPERNVAPDPHSHLWQVDRRPGPRREPVSRAHRSRRARPQPHGDGGQSRRLHPVQPVRPRLPRGAGQRRHRHGRPRLHREDRVRLRRSDGAFDLRRLRRMRPGLPDRRADAGDPRRRPQCPRRLSRPRGALGVPLLRRRLPAHLSHQGRQAPLRHRQGRAREQ